MKQMVLLVIVLFGVLVTTYEGYQYNKEKNLILTTKPESLTDEEIIICDGGYCRCHSNGQCLSGKAISVRPSCGKVLTTGIIINDKDEFCRSNYQQNCEQ